MIDALVLQGLPGVGAGRFRALVDHFGSPQAALDADPRQFAVVAGMRTAPRRQDATRSALGIRKRCADLGIGILVYGTSEYPDRLNHLADPPPVLFVLGNAGLLTKKCTAVVGSRRATPYGRRVSRGLGGSLVAQGRCVVSGMAMGIDAEAHKGALPGPTAAVLGSGVDVVSPPRNRALYQTILEHGAVVSEFAPGVRAEPHHFPRRNRIIAALATDVIIVEASRRSGALITAEIALNLGREVHAVPGPIDRPTSEGTNRLLADGATVIVRIGPVESAGYGGTMPEDPALRDLLLALPHAPVTVEEAADLVGDTPEAVGPRLTILEIRGYLTPTRDGRVMRTPGRRGMTVREGAA